MWRRTPAAAERPTNSCTVRSAPSRPISWCSRPTCGRGPSTPSTDSVPMGIGNSIPIPAFPRCGWCGGEELAGQHVDVLAPPAGAELHHTVGGGEERVVATQADVLAG